MTANASASPPGQYPLRVIGATIERRVEIAALLAPLLPSVARRLADDGICRPRGLIIVGHDLEGHGNRGELTVRDRGFAWLWLSDTITEGPIAEWTVAHELGHLLVACAAGWDTGAPRTTAGERIAGEYIAQRLAGEMLIDASGPRPAYDDADVDHALILWAYTRRAARRLVEVRGDERDYARLCEAVRLLAREYAYASGAAIARPDPAAAELAGWLADRPLISRIVAPLRTADFGAATTLRGLVSTRRTVGSSIDELLASMVEEPAAAAAELAA